MTTLKTPTTVDPVTSAAIAAKLQAVAVDMAYTLKRTSRSLYVKDGEDFCTSIVGLDGLLLTAPDGIGSNLLTLVDCSSAIQSVPDFGPGDVLITNDAHTSGALSTHLADIHVIEPYYYGDMLVGYGWAFIHSSDIGGRVPSSISPFNTEVYQEGLQIPPMKLVKKGKLDPEIEAFIRANTRTPDANMADIKAMLAALRQGRQSVIELIERYGLNHYLAAEESILNYSEQRARELMGTLPTGTFEFSDFLDDDGVSPHPVRFKVALSIESDGSTTVDFTGTDPQLESAFNIVSAGKPNAMTTGRIRSVLTTLDPALPPDGGSTRILNVKGPAGTVVHAQHPAAVGVRHGSAVRVADAIGGAMVEAAPNIMPAAGSGVVIPVVVSEARGTGRVSQVLTRLFGGFGGAHGLDGHDGHDNGYSNLASSPVESSEAELQVQVLRYALRTDSGGAGQWRGGVGRELVFRVDADGTQVLARGLERFIFRPWGVFGGKPGQPTQVILNEGRPTEQRFRKLDVLSVKRGDTVTLRTPGGGGFGNPLKRDPESVRMDVHNQLVTVEAARRDYGVVLIDSADGPVVDDAATSELRNQTNPTATRDFDFGPEREAWESVFSSEWYDAFNARLFSMPASDRTVERRKVFNAVQLELPADFPLVAGTAAQREAASSLAWSFVNN